MQFFDYYWSAASIDISTTNPVGSWVDSNYGKVVSQSVESSKPSYVYDARGFPAIRGDGSDDYLWSDDLDLVLNGPVDSTDYALLAVLSGTAGTRAQVALGSTVSVNRALYHRAATTQMTAVAGSIDSPATIMVGATGTYNESNLQTVMLTTSNGLVKLWINNTVVATREVEGEWQTDRLAICGLLRATFVIPSTTNIHAFGIARGEKARLLHDDPSSMFAFSTVEWTTW